MHITEFTNEMNFILYDEDASEFFSDQAIQERNIAKIEAFFSKYDRLLTGISIYDDRNNVYNIFRDGNNNSITDIYVSREQRRLRRRENVEEHSAESVFTIPVFRENRTIANIIFRVDTGRYIEAVFEDRHIDNTLWQWLVNEKGEIITSTFAYGLSNTHNFDPIAANFPYPSSGGSLIHSLETPDGPIRVISAYHPVRIMNQDFLVVFSMNSGFIISDIIISVIAVSATTFLILVFIIGLLLYFLRNKRKTKSTPEKSELTVNEILESLPLGIIIKGMDGSVKTINSTALDILKLRNSEEIVGKDISNMFFLFRDYSGKPYGNHKENTSEYVYYEADEEEEIILYKKEIPFNFSGEKVTVEAFIDISPIEKVRKSESVLREAKTEFLKKVSHDIRNPLNGIINMTDLMEAATEPGQPEKVKLELIRNCCEDILMVVNDIVDYPGFDSGRVSMEEIPFDLKEEINLAVNTVRNKARKKNIGIYISVDEKIPEKLIGDPFHIRQVLIKLLSNSLKYTGEGKISLSANLNKRVTGSILLEFVIEDTGRGIPPALLKKLNGNDNPSGAMPSESPGLNKTRQLIQLMKGEMHIESPPDYKDKPGGTGTRVRFQIQVFSNDFSGKNLNTGHTGNPGSIKALVLADDFKKKSGIQGILGKLGIPCETTLFNDSAIELLKSRLADPARTQSVVFIIDNAESNGFAIARKLHESNITGNHLIIIISSVNKTGNFLKSRLYGADYYLTEPCDISEIADLLSKYFPRISFDTEMEALTGDSQRELKILVAEDNTANQIVAQSLFKRLGHNIDLAANGKEALEKIKEKDYDIVFMDIRMPKKNGLDTAYEMRMLGYSMPIVAMTANAGEADKTEALEAGMNNFIAKPVNIDVLKNIMTKLLSKSS